MNLFNELEAKKNKIDNLSKVIHTANIYINSYQKEDSFIKRIIEKNEINKIKLKKLNIDFDKYVSDIITNNREELFLWINFHKKIIIRIEHFSNFINQKRQYSEERLKYIKNVKNAWDNFIFNKKIPKTFLGEDYKLFCDIYKLKFKDTIKLSITYKEDITTIEEIRQQLTILSKQLSQMDTIIDKGSAWGASDDEIDNAYKNITIVDAEYKEKELKLKSIIEKKINKNSRIIEEWHILHLLTCISIIDYAYTKTALTIEKDSTRLFVADETFYLWKNIHDKKSKIIIPNTYYLRDYDLFFNQLIQ